MVSVSHLAAEGSNRQMMECAQGLPSQDRGRGADPQNQGVWGLRLRHKFRLRRDVRLGIGAPQGTETETTALTFTNQHASPRHLPGTAETTIHSAAPARDHHYMKHSLCYLTLCWNLWQCCRKPCQGHPHARMVSDHYPDHHTEHHCRGHLHHFTASPGPSPQTEAPWRWYMWPRMK